MRARLRFGIAGSTVAAALLCLVGGAGAADKGFAGKLEEPPVYGLYYDRYEPAFYTGFAPRVSDPRRLHLHLGRGNQLRVTAVLSGDVLRDYAKDLVARQRIYHALVDRGRMTLTQNRGLEEFDRALAEADVAGVVAAETKLPVDAVVARNLVLVGKLNPGRVFHIRLDANELLKRWTTNLVPADRGPLNDARRIELLEKMMPTRLFVSGVDPALASALDALVKRCGDIAARGAAMDPARDDFLRVLAAASHGIYPVRDGVLDFHEFTAVYPVGTLNDTIQVHGRPIPLFPTPGRRALVIHQRTRVIDHVPTDAIYSYFPWIPYIHIGTRLHDALHTLFWRMKPEETSFLPAGWKTAKDRDGQPYEYLWLLSRGPMSHGCTHVNAGHLSELRQILPAEEERLADVDLFYNRSEFYDVFDVDGDFAPEVVGVRYWIAYSLKNDRPDRLRAPNERRAYYDWLYAGELGYDADGRGRFADIRAGGFDGLTAVAGDEYRGVPLWEAAYEPEKVQFYRLVDVDFARELRRVGASHPFPGLEATVTSGR